MGRIARGRVKQFCVPENQSIEHAADAVDAVEGFAVQRIPRLDVRSAPPTSGFVFPERCTRGGTLA